MNAVRKTRNNSRLSRRRIFTELDALHVKERAKTEGTNSWQRWERQLDRTRFKNSRMADSAAAKTCETRFNQP